MYKFIYLTKKEWKLLHFIIPISIKIDYFDEEENLIILGQFMEKLGSEWVNDE